MKPMKRFIIPAVIATVMLASAGPALADSPICHNGVLSDDAGLNCSDGMYARVYGQGAVTRTRSISTRSYSSYGGGSSNPMVDPYCESSGNPQAVSPDGRYYGLYQFDYSTWVASGGSPGSYGHASVGEQDRVASQVTYDAWPNC